MILNVARQSDNGVRRYSDLRAVPSLPITLSRSFMPSMPRFDPDRNGCLRLHRITFRGRDSVQAQHRASESWKSNVTPGFPGLASQESAATHQPPLWQLIQPTGKTLLDPESVLVRILVAIARTSWHWASPCCFYSFVLGSFALLVRRTRRCWGCLWHLFLPGASG